MNQTAFDREATLLHQANALHLKLYQAEIKRDDAGLEFSHRLSNLIQRANDRCQRRYKKTMTAANQLLAGLNTMQTTD